MKSIRIVLMTLSMALMAVGVSSAEMRGHPRLRAAALHDRECVKDCRSDVGACVSPAAQTLEKPVLAGKGPLLAVSHEHFHDRSEIGPRKGGPNLTSIMALKRPRA